MSRRKAVLHWRRWVRWARAVDPHGERQIPAPPGMEKAYMRLVHHEYANRRWTLQEVEAIKRRAKIDALVFQELCEIGGSGD